MVHQVIIIAIVFMVSEINMFWLGLGSGLILSVSWAQNRFTSTNMISIDLMTSDFSTNLVDASRNPLACFVVISACFP